MSGTKQTFENLPEEKQSRVLTEATQEFADHGYQEASINRIVARLGIAKGSVFKYFGSKAGLFEHIFSRAVADFKGPLKAIRDTDGDFFSRIEQSFLAGGAFIDAHPQIYRIYLKMLFNENFPLRGKFLQEIRQAHAKYLGALVDDGIASGELRPDLDREMTVFLLHTMLDRFLQNHAVPSQDTGIDPAPHTMKERARAMSEFLRHGLSAK
ncbi:TetR/AcrR family transcriptional regulator [Pseudodesulfovibrio sp.]|uniref:TetR/AcrR family transcriptional regulator n=1 Tax=unclassified Pseudodesulfovibrio TaxID=2661612 RepID=UPI003B00826C